MQLINNTGSKNNYLLILLIVFSLNMFGKCATLKSSFIVSQAIICGPQSTTISFTNSSTGSQATSAAYTWYLNGAILGNTTGLTAPGNATISDIGTYVFMLIGTDSNGCKDTALVNVFIRPIPVANFTINGIVCSGTTISFKNMSSGTGGFTTFSWDFGDGKKSVEQNPTHTYANVNSYAVSLTISNGNGCSNTYKDTITLSQAPLAKIEGKDKDGDTKYCLSAEDSAAVDTVRFENLSEHAQSYRWDFGDGSPLLTTTSKDAITHVYTTFGTFKVTMIAVSSDNCEKSASLTVIFNKAVKASFTLQPSEVSGCVPHGVMPVNTSSNGDEYTWNFGDGTPTVTTVNTAPFVHLYKKSGVYIISLKTSNSCNTSLSDSDTIRVHALAVSKFELNTLTGCAPQEITFKNLSHPSSGNVYHWNFGDGSVWNGTTDPGKKNYEEGKWKIQLTATNQCGSDSSFQWLTVAGAPVAPVVKDETICKETAATLQINQPNRTVEWFDAAVNGNLLFTGTLFTTPVLTETTVYFVQCKSGSCVSERIPVKVNVLSLPDPPVVSGLSICKGNFAIVKIASAGKYEWFNVPTGGACLDTTDSFTTPLLFVNTEYYVQRSEGGCKSRRSNVKILVNDPPKANYKSNTVCLNDSSVFQDLSTGNASNWLWDFGDGHTSRMGPVTKHTYLSPGSFIVKLVVSNGIGCYDSILQVVQVNEPIFAQINVKDSACIFENILFKDASVFINDSIIESGWYFGDGSPVVKAMSPDHVFDSARSYTIEHSVISAKGCKSRISQTLYIVPLPLADFTSSNTCLVQKTTFKDASTTDVTHWNWDFGDGGTSIEQHPQHTYTKGGYLQVSLLVKTSLGCGDTIARRIFVYRHPVAAFTADTVCWGDTTTFLNTSQCVDGNIDYVFWNFGDGITSNVFAPQHVLQTQTDSFRTTLTIITNHGCRDTISQWVKTRPIPVFHFFPTEKTGCAAFTTAFIDSSMVAGGKITNWLWNFGDGNSTHKRYPVHTFTEPGNYRVTLKVTTSYGCGLEKALPYPIVVLSKPQAAFEATPQEVSIDQATVQFTNNSSNSIMWDWNFGDHKTSVNKNNFHTYTDTGTFMVTLIALSEHGCNDTAAHHVRVNAQPQLYIPNAFSPNDDDLNDVFLPVGNGILIFQMTIFDRWGKQIFYTEDLNTGWNGCLNDSGEKVLEGIYVYKIYIKDVLQVTRNYTGNVFVVRK